MDTRAAIWTLAACTIAASGAAAGCISETRAPTTDTGVQDTGGDIAADAGDSRDATPECTVADDCTGEAGRCRAWTCDAGSCVTRVAAARACDDENPCTSDDRCDSSGRCLGTALDEGDACDDDGLVCTGTGFCQAGTCNIAVRAACEPSPDPCLANVCVEPSGTCETVPRPAGDSCTQPTGSSGECSRGACVPEGMVWIPPSTFVMGCDRSLSCAADAGPTHVVKLSGYAIEATELSQEAYQGCVLSNACDPARVDMSTTVPDSGVLPARNLTWAMANDACTFRARRLCTEAEWEKAARGTDQRVYPWGSSQSPTCELATIFGGGFLLPGCGNNGPRAVDTAPAGASPYGALNMSGNVREWVADYYRADAYDGRDALPDPIEDPVVSQPTATGGFVRVARGGAYNNGVNADQLRTTTRAEVNVLTELRSTGTRCCWTPP